MIEFGCVADDFTGAGDAASYLTKGGLNTVLVSGVPDGDLALPHGTQAVVIALKTRTQETRSAVNDTNNALQWLKNNGAKQFYIKYCSTFDSMPEGNIGPIADAALTFANARYTLLCPSLPDNGRTVLNGVLYVSGVPLEKTPMNRHPLTPMWDSRIAKLMRRQSPYPVITANRQALADASFIGRLLAVHDRFYLVPDYETQDDAHHICRLFGKLPLLTGGSGLLEALAGLHRPKSTAQSAGGQGQVDGKALILAGSCSTATQLQVTHYLRNGGLGIAVYPECLKEDAQANARLWRQAQALASKDVILYSCASLGDASTLGDTQAAALLEDAMAYFATQAMKDGFTHIIVAGGETSGAVTRALGFKSFLIGQSVAPGVPVLTPLEKQTVRLVLKSGNFGGENFFTQTIQSIRGGPGA